MRLIVSVFILLIAMPANTQTALKPAEGIVEKRWLINRQQKMVWYAVNDTTRSEIGKTTTQISNEENKIIVITTVSIKGAPAAWIDTTIANAADLRPVYHSSYNKQRDMILHFDQVVNGFYTDKAASTVIPIYDTINEGYFDSNLYPTLITWLPLHEAYKQTIAIYDYTPGTKRRLVKATVHNVSKESFRSKKSGVRDVWVITVSDEIGDGQNGFSTYYVDVTDRRLWRQKVEVNGRKMEMEYIEE